MKRHALLVGSFVIGALVLVVVTIVWLSGASLFQQQLYAVVHFEGSVKGLYVGAPVTFRGVPVGQVESIGIEVDDDSLNARIPVRMSLRASAVRFDGGDDDGSRVDLPTLIKRGLKARLVAQSFVTGQKLIDLDFLPDTPATLMGSKHDPEIPAVADRFGVLVDQIAELPLRETVQDLRQTLQTVQATLDSTRKTLELSSKELSSTAAQARQTLATASTALRQVQGNAQSALASVTRLSDTTEATLQGVRPELQETLRGARAAAESARVAMDRVSELSAPGAPLRADLDSAVRDLSQAARGLREWSELLEEQPNAVIFGADRP
ncbi:MlaD family protein [Aquabacterium sp. A7-Y]|uniref:MlaD family protein n=1 Tax=Aquabacterium sp. A7-Y TaxID=1349605 RepID=UPI00223CD390|nr:MlaD family protein [Aquabacterium sp. A7-Y]MCW7536632.1 MlaD family protein [Aquabacterium sp. A7-Y]